MASGDPPPPVSRSSGIIINAAKVGNLQVANTLTNIQPRRGGGGSGSVRAMAQQVQGGAFPVDPGRLSCVLDSQLKDGRPCRIIQTDLSPVMWISDRINEVIIANEYIDVSYHLNADAVKKLLEANCNPESVEGALGQCLAGLEWSSQAVLQQKLTAFKLSVVEEKLPRLLQTVLDLISNESKRSEVIRLVVRAFRDFGALLKAVKVSSVTFVFQLEDDAKAEEMLRSEEMQGKLIGVLYKFLPEWVCVHARWEVGSCEAGHWGYPGAWGAEAGVVWRIPRQPGPLFAEPRTEPALDAERLRRVIEPVVNESIERGLTRAIAPFHHAMDQIQRILQAGESDKDKDDDRPGQQENDDQPGQETSDLPGQEENDDQPRQETSDLPGQQENDDRPRQETNDDLPGQETSDLHEQEAIEPEETSRQVQTLTRTPDQRDSPGSQGRPPGPASPVLLQELKQGDLFTPESPETLPGDASMYDTQSSDVRQKFREDSKAVSPRTVYSVPETQLVLGRAAEGSREGVESLEPHSKVPESLMDLAERFSCSAVKTMEEIGRESVKILNKDSHQHLDRAGAEGPEPLPECEGPTPAMQTSESRAGTGRDATSASRKTSKTKEAEDLLNWVNVKSNASQSKSPEIVRLMEQVEHGLQGEEVPSPVAKTMDTVMVLDTSDSIAKTHLDELKAAALTFVDGIELNVETMNLEENLAVIQMGGRAWVRQHLTNDYSRVRDAIIAMTPGSPTMPTGGRTPLFEALLVCLAAIEDRGGIINVAGCHRVRPRLIIFTDGRPTDEATEIGPDIQTNVNSVKFTLVKLVSELVSKKHKTTPKPISWVPIGTDVDMVFLKSLAELGGGKVVPQGNIEELCRYYSMQQAVGCVFQLACRNREMFDDEEKLLPAIDALGGNLNKMEKAYITGEVMKKLGEPEETYRRADDFHYVYEDKELVESGQLLPLGTRVVRGRDWKWKDQDGSGPGTVIQHKAQDKGLFVMWDTGKHNWYRYGQDGNYDVQPTGDCPRIASASGILDIGVEVQRGVDWKFGSEDGGDFGVVIRNNRQGKVKVRWSNGVIKSYVYGERKQEVKPLLRLGEPRPVQWVPDEELGAVGGYSPTQEPGRRVWQYQAGSGWRLYDAKAQDKVLKEFLSRKTGSCVVERDGLLRRVIFKRNEERSLDKGTIIKVRSMVVSEKEYLKMLQEEGLSPHPQASSSSRQHSELEEDSQESDNMGQSKSDQ